MYCINLILYILISMLSSLHILHVDGVNNLIRLCIYIYIYIHPNHLLSSSHCFVPTTDVYVQSRILAVAPENVFFRLIERRCLCFLRARVLIVIPLHLLARLWFPAAGCFRFSKTNSSILHEILLSTFRWKKSMVGQIRTHALRVNILQSVY